MTIAGVHIAGSPITIKVEPGPVCAGKTIPSTMTPPFATCPSLSSRQGQPLSILFELRDCWANLLTKLTDVARFAPVASIRSASLERLGLSGLRAGWASVTVAGPSSFALVLSASIPGEFWVTVRSSGSLMACFGSNSDRGLRSSQTIL